MPGDDSFSESFDAALRDIFPDDLEAEAAEIASQRDRSEYSRNLEREYTLLNTVRPGELQSLVAAQIEPYAAAFDASKGTSTTAESLLQQYLQSLDGAHIVEVYAGAAFYCAAKIQELGYTPDEIADTGPDLLTKKVLLRSSKRIARKLGLDPSLFTDVSQYVDRFCSILETSDEVRQRAHEIVDRCEEAGLSSGKSPTGWAAAAIYLSGLEAGAGLRQHDIAEVAEVTEVTIRNRYQEQQAFLQRDDTPGDTFPEHIEWVATRTNLDTEYASTATNAWERLEESTHTWRGVDGQGVPLCEALPAEPSLWAGAFLLLAAEALDESLGTRRLTSTLDTDGADLKARHRTLRHALKVQGLRHHEFSTLAE